jgi:hypothetical protein
MAPAATQCALGGLLNRSWDFSPGAIVSGRCMPMQARNQIPINGLPEIAPFFQESIGGTSG